MADIEKRAAMLERDMAAIKDRTNRHDEELTNIPDLIRLEFRLANSRTARLAADLLDFKTEVVQRFDKVDGRFTKTESRFDKFEGKVDTLIKDLPKIVAEVMREVLDERDRRR